MEHCPLTGAVYIRVSTNGQMELSPESQLREILSYAGSREIEIPVSFIFMEKEGHSGRKAENRPEFQRMIATAKLRPRPFDVILVWKFSRFARNLDESAFYKGMLRKKLGIDVVSISEPVVDGMYGRLIELIIEWQDEFYSCNLSSEVRRGMTEHARQGGYQAPAPYGYRYNGPGSIPSPVEQEAESVRFIFSQFADAGHSPSAIAAELNEKGCSTKRGNPFDRRAVLYILQNPFYTGMIRWNPSGRRQTAEQKGGWKDPGKPQKEVIYSKGRHPALISEEQFAQAAKLLKDRARRSDGEIGACQSSSPSRIHTPRRHCLSGILRCPVCGAVLSYSDSQSPVFQCWRYARGLHRGSASISGRRAKAALISSLEQLERAASRLFEGCVWLPDPDKSESQENGRQKQKLKNLESRERRILTAYENGIDSLEEYRRKKERAAAERRELCLPPNGPAASLPPVSSLSELIRTPDVSEELKGRALRTVLDSAVYIREEDRFYFTYRLKGASF